MTQSSEYWAADTRLYMLFIALNFETNGNVMYCV